jgi:hypothetical protein
MARSNGISVWIAAPLCAAALVSMPARAEDSLFDRPVAQSPEAPKPVAEPAPKPAAAPTPKHVAAKHKPAHKPKPAAAASVPATPASLPPVVVQAPEPQAPAPEPQRAFGQQMPQQSLINRFMNPAAPSGQIGPDGKPVAPEPEEETLPNGMPKKFLLNHLFDSSALEPENPDPRSFMAQAQPPASEPAPSNWWDNATKTLGFGGQQQAPSGNLPTVNVTAPANRNASPPPPAPAAVAPPSEPNWFERATGFGGGDKTIPDYSERPKLVVPHNLDALPPPNPRDERRVLPPPNAEALTKPPPGFMEKVQGADGNVSGFTDQDAGKKGLFNWF